jgi:hypothetical protein
MKPAISLLLIVCIFASGCKKAVEKLQEDAVLQAMTEGKWLVSKYLNGNNDITDQFTTYRFQFHSNRTVDAIKNNILEKSGTWDASTENKTILANFVNSQNPLTFLNGTWTLTKYSWNYVEATMTVNFEERFLRLDKE